MVSQVKEFSTLLCMGKCKSLGLLNCSFDMYLPLMQASLVAQLVKNPPVMWETWVRSLGWEDPLEKGLAWRIPWLEEAGRLQSTVLQRAGHS